MLRRKLITPIIVTSAALGLAVATAIPASAAPTATITTLTTKVFGPFNIDVSGPRVLVADGFTGVVSRIRPNGNLETIAANPGGDTSGVASGDGMVAYTSGDGMNGTQKLTVIRPGPDLVVDISAFEAANNPDKVNFYGVHNASRCVRRALEAQGAPVAYHGVVDAHAYSVAYAGNGWWLVGDAAGNDVLKVSPAGAVSLVRVLPHQPVTFTAQSAAAAGLPRCFAGVTYNFEPVPTDVEVHNGQIYMSLLPGGPEDPSLGARGSAYRMGMNGNGLTKIGSGFLGTTNIAVSATGAVYVSELFAGQVSKIVNGHGVPVASLPGPLGLEFAHGALYAGVIAQTDAQGNVTGPGSVVRIDLG